MPRVFRPIRLFVEEDGQRKPTLFFFIFTFWILAFLFMASYTLVAGCSARREAAAYLSRTPAPTSTRTPAPTVTRTPTVTPTPSDTLTPTPFVYSDPAGWELAEVTMEDGSTRLELQDWQQAEIRHFFEEYYNLAWRSETGMPELEQVLEYLTGDFHEYISSDVYPELIRRGYYLEYPPLKQLIVDVEYLPRHSEAWGGFRVELTLVNPINWETKLRLLEDGEIYQLRDCGPIENRFQLIFIEDQWKIYFSKIVQINPY